MIIDGLETLPGAPASGDELPIEREDTAYKIDYDRLAAAILALCVTGIKGNAETTYRVGNVNITAANIGAKATQSAVSDPSASGTSLTFIATISQNAQGVISPTKKTVPSASQSAAGVMSADDKKKLDGIASGAQVNTVTGVKGNAESSYRTGNINITPANIGAKATQSAVSDPTASGTSTTFISGISQNAQGVITPSKKSVPTMGGATASANGTAGLVPAPPSSGYSEKFLGADGTWKVPSEALDVGFYIDSAGYLCQRISSD